MSVARLSAMHTAQASIPVLDESVLSELQTLGPDVVAEIVDLFLADVPMRLRKLKDAISAHSRDAVLREAHGLKGSALGVGAARLAHLCAAIECDARNDNLDQATARSASLQSEFAEAQTALKTCAA